MSDKNNAELSRVAKAIFDASTFYGEWENQSDSNREVCEDMARAAIKELHTRPAITPQQAAKALYDAYPRARDLPDKAYHNAAVGNFFTALRAIAEQEQDTNEHP